MKPSSSGRLLAVGLVCLIGGLAAIVYATLEPFAFIRRPLTIALLPEYFGLAPNSGLDLPRNLMLFMPLGFGLGVLLERRGLSRRRMLALVLVAGFLVTLTVELLQIFVPVRTPNVSDMLANTLGSGLGLVCLWLWHRLDNWWLRARPYLTIGRITAVALVYALAILLLQAYLTARMQPRDWGPANPDPPLPVAFGTDGACAAAPPTDARAGWVATFLVLPAAAEPFSPARFIAVSGDARAGRVTLDQKGPALLARLDAPFAGRGGRSPELRFNHTLDGLPQWVSVRFNGVTAVLTSSRKACAAVDLVPGVALADLIYQIDRWQLFVREEKFWQYDMLFQGLFFIPLGLLAGLGALQLGRGRQRVLFSIALIGVPGLVFLWQIAALQRLTPFWQDVAVGLGLAIFSVGLTLIWGWSHSAPSAG